MLMVLGLLSKFLDNQLMKMDNQSLSNGSSRLMLRESVEIVTLKNVFKEFIRNYRVLHIRLKHVFRVELH